MGDMTIEGDLKVRNSPLHWRNSVSKIGSDPLTQDGGKYFDAIFILDALQKMKSSSVDLQATSGTVTSERVPLADSDISHRHLVLFHQGGFVKGHTLTLGKSTLFTTAAPQKIILEKWSTTETEQCLNHILRAPVWEVDARKYTCQGGDFGKFIGTHQALNLFVGDFYNPNGRVHGKEKTVIKCYQSYQNRARNPKGGKGSLLYNWGDAGIGSGGDIVICQDPPVQSRWISTMIMG